MRGAPACLCVCICVYTCMCVYLYMYYKYACIYGYIYVCMHAGMFSYKYATNVFFSFLHTRILISLCRMCFVHLYSCMYTRVYVRAFLFFSFFTYLFHCIGCITHVWMQLFLYVSVWLHSSCISYISSTFFSSSFSHPHFSLYRTYWILGSVLVFSPSLCLDGPITPWILR